MIYHDSTFDKLITNYQEEIYKISHKAGWYEEDRSFGDDIALLHSEVSEMFEAYRDNDFYHIREDGKPEGICSEAADIFIRLLDTCRRYNISLANAVDDKLIYNSTRSYRHGGKRI